MASLRTSKGGNFIACFRFEGRQHQRALKTKDCRAAEAALGRIVDRIYQLTTGGLKVPAHVDPADFIVWGDAGRPGRPPASNGGQARETNVPSLDDLIQKYLEDIQRLKANSTVALERIHLNNLKRHLDGKTGMSADRVTRKDLNGFLRAREQEVEPVTVQKERQTLMSFFAWVVREDAIPSSPAEGLRRVQAGEDKTRFKTLEDVEEIVRRGGLHDDAELGLWESLYLTPQEIGEILALARERAQHDFVHPMFALAAYTGMRRGEIVCRLRWSDVNFEHKLVTARSKKQSRQRAETSREIDMHPELEAVLQAYKARRPKGQQVICFPDTLEPLTVHQAHEHFRRALRGTRWEREMPSGSKKIIIGFHTFRHSFASNLAVQGVDQRIIDRWMGHTTEAMRRRYQHLFPKKLSESIRMLSYEV